MVRNTIFACLGQLTLARAWQLGFFPDQSLAMDHVLFYDGFKNVTRHSMCGAETICPVRIQTTLEKIGKK